MPIVSVTRFRARSVRFLPLFMFQAQRTISQLRTAEGFLGGAIRRDTRLALWTMTMWCDQAAVVAYVTGGAHGKAMPHLRHWGLEAGAVRWEQSGRELPDWPTATRRLRAEGHASRLDHPGPGHADLAFEDHSTRFEGRL